ncbi:MAG: hypothetical protein ACI4HI_16095 [Lachnospiraceae bacterium]
MISKQEAKKKILDYFKKENIPYRYLNEKKGLVSIDDSDTVYLCVEIPDVIGGCIETTLRFWEEHLYCQSYYCQPVVQSEEEKMRAAKMINYLNFHLNYDCDSLYKHIFALDEDKGDIMNGCLIRYELLEEHFEETMNHILNFSVQQLVDVCIPLIGYIAGELNYSVATKVGIDHEIMGKPIPVPED